MQKSTTPVKDSGSGVKEVGETTTIPSTPQETKSVESIEGPTSAPAPAKVCSLSAELFIAQFFTKMISISLCKRSQSAHPTHHILNRESQSHFPMENC